MTIMGIPSIIRVNASPVAAGKVEIEAMVRDALSSNQINGLYHEFPCLFFWDMKEAWLNEIWPTSQSTPKLTKPSLVNLQSCIVKVSERLGRAKPGADFCRNYIERKRNKMDEDTAFLFLYAFFENWCAEKTWMCLCGSCQLVTTKNNGVKRLPGSGCGDPEWRKLQAKRFLEILCGNRKCVSFNEPPGYPVSRVLEFCIAENIDVIFPVHFDSAIRWRTRDFFESFEWVKRFCTSKQSQARFVYVLRPFDWLHDNDKAAGEAWYRAAFERIRKAVADDDLFNKKVKILMIEHPNRHSEYFDIKSAESSRVNKAKEDIQEFNLRNGIYSKSVAATCAYDFIAFRTVRDEISYGIVESHQNPGGLTDEGRFIQMNSAVVEVESLGGAVDNAVRAAIDLIDGKSTGSNDARWRVIGICEFLGLPVHRCA